MRRIFLATTIAILVIAGSGWTLIRAFEDSSTEEPSPPADAPAYAGNAVLRLDGASSVACGSGEVVLTVFLDELQATPPRSDRLTAFQVRLTFDPSVVQAERFELDSALTGKGSGNNTRGSWAIAGPLVDNRGGSIFAGAIALAVGEDEVERTAVRKLSGGTPLARIVLRAISPGDAKLAVADVTSHASGSAEYAASATVGVLAVTDGSCADPLPTTTPYVAPPTVTPEPAPRTQSRGELPAGLPPAPEGCEWVLSNPDPPLLVILRYCGDEQTQWLYDTRTDELTQARTAGGAPPRVPDCARDEPPSCPTPTVQSPPPPAAGCSWEFANLDVGWIEGDPTPPSAPWNSFVEVCEGFMTGRVFDPLNGEISLVPPRTEPVSDRTEG